MEFDGNWLAGFFDGEGSIGIYPRNYNRTKTIRYYVLVVSLAQSGDIGEKVCKKLQHLYGGSAYAQKGVTKKVQWKWNISADKAVDFLKEIEPFLIIKKEEALLGITFQSLEHKTSTDTLASEYADKVKLCKVNY